MEKKMFEYIPAISDKCFKNTLKIIILQSQAMNVSRITAAHWSRATF